MQKPINFLHTLMVLRSLSSMCLWYMLVLIMLLLLHVFSIYDIILFFIFWKRFVFVILFLMRQATKKRFVVFLGTERNKGPEQQREEFDFQGCHKLQICRLRKDEITLQVLGYYVLRLYHLDCECEEIDFNLLF